MEKHTPGPWRAVSPTGYVFTEGDPYGRGQMNVAQVRGWGHLTGRGGGCAFDERKAVEIQDANAALIAAAPDLLAACHEIRALASGWDEGGALGPREPLSWESVARMAMDIATAAIAKAEATHV